MDYNEMLFAYYVRKEALAQVSTDLDNGVIPEDQAPSRILEVAKTIVTQTEGIADLIRFMQEEGSNPEMLVELARRLQPKG